MPCQALLTHSPTLSSSLRQGITTLISTAPWPRKPFLAEHCGQLNSARNSTDSDKFAPLKFTGTPPHDKYHSCRVAPYHVSGRVRWKSQAVRLRTAPDARDALSAHEADRQSRHYMRVLSWLRRRRRPMQDLRRLPSNHSPVTSQGCSSRRPNRAPCRPATCESQPPRSPGLTPPRGRLRR